ncbi:MAG: formate--tetrahydrofolate ligase, partial [Succiniclasticum sp.]|nr:formate--tetrahydrofolate ligase [Succiniclasticum sp.]
NLLAAMIDNHLHFGNELGIDPTSIVWKRCEDMNDRALRTIVVGLGEKVNGPVREDHFIITAASEIMAVFCLASDLEDLRRRLGQIVVGYTFEGTPVRAEQLNAVGAMMSLLKDAFRPNLIQTIEHTPALVHGGPFANIAHGCNSVRATKAALKMADYTITEAGFGADLGAEKFLDIKCRMAGLRPDAIVLVATIQALKYNGGVARADLKQENVEALEKGLVNLARHIENIQKYEVPVVVSLNSFVSDTDAENAVVEKFCREHNCEFSKATVWADGGAGGIDLAEKVIRSIEEKENNFHQIYDLDKTLQEKIETIATEIYGAGKVKFTANARKQLQVLEDRGFGG